MEFDLRRLISNIDESVDIDTTYSFSKEELEGTDVMELNNVSINGEITKDAIDDFAIYLSISGTMVLPCSLTLKPVDYPFNINISGNLQEMLDEINENSKKIVNSIDILPIIWENILMEIPSKVTSEEASSMKAEGEGWKFVTEEEKKGNPELEKLKDLL